MHATATIQIKPPHQSSLAVLSALSERLDGAMAVLYAGALPIIVNDLSSCNSRPLKEYCVN